MSRPHYDMVEIARRVLRENGFDPEMPSGIERSLPAKDPVEDAVDLRALKWSSIDNDDSRDLDQIEWAELLPANAIRVRIGIADVDAFAPKGSEVDRYAGT
ncbi:MAG: RNB domain-containing ribonuclease, partial [Polyangiales bacterium]